MRMPALKTVLGPELKSVLLASVDRPRSLPTINDMVVVGLTPLHDLRRIANSAWGPAYQALISRCARRYETAHGYNTRWRSAAMMLRLLNAIRAEGEFHYELPRFVPPAHRSAVAAARHAAD